MVFKNILQTRNFRDEYCLNTLLFHAKANNLESNEDQQEIISIISLTDDVIEEEGC